MKYKTKNELDHFNFTEAYIAEIQKVNGYFQMTLDNVTILPDNSCNRDIRQMRANGLILKIQDGNVESLTEEGYKVYNADGKLIEQYEDQQFLPEQHNEILKALADGESAVYSLEKVENTYVFTIDASNERTYVLQISGIGDVEEWERFLNK